MVPTGCESIDSLLGGGLLPKRINQVYGASGTGKTNLCLQTLVNAHNAGKDVVYIDTEGGFSERRIEQLNGGEVSSILDKVFFQRVLSFSEQNRAINGLKDLDVDLVIVDSLTSQYRPELSNGDAREVNRELSLQVKRLTRIARENEIPVLITNQVYSDFESEENEVIPIGGDVLKYSSKVILQLAKENGKRKAILRKHLFKKEGESRDFEISHCGIKGI